MEQTYWNNAGKYQETASALQALIPMEGTVAEPRKNKELERYRKAVNCYYDLYNNGLCNRAAQFRTVYGVPASYYGSYRNGYGAQLYVIVEEKLNSIIEAAAAEQGIVVSTQQTLFA